MESNEAHYVLAFGACVEYRLTLVSTSQLKRRIRHLLVAAFRTKPLHHRTLVLVLFLRVHVPFLRVRIEGDRKLASHLAKHCNAIDENVNNFNVARMMAFEEQTCWWPIVQATIALDISGRL